MRAELLTDGLTDRHDEANSRYSQFEAPNKELFLSNFSLIQKVLITQAGNFAEPRLLGVALNQADTKQRNKIFAICLETRTMDNEFKKGKGMG
jgi:hypothetical protein